MALESTLPETQQAERRLRELSRQRYGITYIIREGPPNYAGLRTPSDTLQLLKWRDEAVKKGVPYYRVSPYSQGFHGIGGAFDITIAVASLAGNRHVKLAREAGEEARRKSGGTAVQVRGAGDAAALKKAYALVGSIAPEVGLRWGGLFSAPADPFHFELAQNRSDVVTKWARYEKHAMTVGKTSGTVATLLILAGGAVFWWWTHRQGA